MRTTADEGHKKHRAKGTLGPDKKVLRVHKERKEI